MDHIFVKIAQIEGASLIADYAGEIVCDAIQMGIDLPVLQSGSARTQGSSIRSGILLTHKLDKASPKLRAHTVSGTGIGNVTITVTKKEGNYQDNLTNGEGGETMRGWMLSGGGFWGALPSTPCFARRKPWWRPC